MSPEAIEKQNVKEEPLEVDVFDEGAKLPDPAQEEEKPKSPEPEIDDLDSVGDLNDLFPEDMAEEKKEEVPLPPKPEEPKEEEPEEELPPEPEKEQPPAQPPQQQLSMDEANKKFLNDLANNPLQTIQQAVDYMMYQRRNELTAEVMKEMRKASNVRNYEAARIRKEFSDKHTDFKTLKKDMAELWDNMSANDRSNFDMNSRAGFEALYWRAKAEKSKKTVPTAKLASSPSGSAASTKTKTLTQRQRDLARKANMTEEEYMRLM